MTADEKEFIKGCCKFKNYADIGQYIEDIQKCLVLSSWQYSEDEAKELIKKDKEFIKQAFADKEPADDVAAEVGYSCG